MPFELQTELQDSIWTRMNSNLRTHNSYGVRNKYHKSHDMDAWFDEKQRIVSDTRLMIKILQNQVKERGVDMPEHAARQFMRFIYVLENSHPICYIDNIIKDVIKFN